MDERKLIVHIMVRMTIYVAFSADGAPAGVKNRDCAVVRGLVSKDFCVGQLDVIACKFVSHKLLIFINCGNTDGVIAAVQKFQNAEISVNK